jgi:hypothetical protein
LQLACLRAPHHLPACQPPLPHQLLLRRHTHMPSSQACTHLALACTRLHANTTRRWSHLHSMFAPRRDHGMSIAQSRVTLGRRGRMPLRLYVCLSVSLSVCLSPVSLSFFLSVHYLSVCPCCPSVSMAVTHGAAERRGGPLGRPASAAGTGTPAAHQKGTRQTW